MYNKKIYFQWFPRAGKDPRELNWEVIHARMGAVLLHA